MVLAWKGPHAHKIMIADYEVEQDTIFQEMVEALARTQEAEIALMATTLPANHLRAAEEVGFLPDPTFEREQRRRFLYYPLTPPDPPSALTETSEAFPEGWRVSLLDTMLP
jgi:hypothetical protein